MTCRYYLPYFGGCEHGLHNCDTCEAYEELIEDEERDDDSGEEVLYVQKL